MQDEVTELEISDARDSLQACQRDRGLKSCMNCEEIFSCTVRSNYVNLIYKSMNPTGTGEFEF